MKPALVWAALALAGCGGAAAHGPSSGPPAAGAPAAPQEDPKAMACDAAPEALDRVAAEDAVASAFVGTSGKVAEVRVEADDPDLAERARPLVELAAGAELTDEAVRADVRRLWSLGDLADVQVQGSGAADAVTVRYVIRRAPAVQNSFQLGDGASDAIAKELGLTAGARYQAGTVSTGLSNARDELVEQGYRDAKIFVTGRQFPDNRVDVCIHVDRGPRLLLGNVTITGNQAVPTADLLALLTAKPGEPLSELVLERDLLRMQALYFDRGFLTSTIAAPEIDVDSGALDVRITVAEGPAFTIGSIGVKGDLVTTKAAYQRRLTVKPGDVFNRSKVMADMERIRALHREQNAEDVEIEPETTLDPAKKRVDLVLRIRAKAAQ